MGNGKLCDGSYSRFALACMHAGTKKQNAQKALVTESDGRRSVTDRSPLVTQSYIDKLLQFHNFYEFLSF